MTDDGNRGSEDSEQQESGGGALRKKFEDARRTAVDLIVQQNPDLKPQDFNGVEPAEFVTHAESLKEQRNTQLAEALGVSVDDLPAAIKRARGESDEGSSKGTQETPQSRAASLGGIGGTPARVDFEAGEQRDLHGEALIAAAFAQEEREK